MGWFKGIFAALMLAIGSHAAAQEDANSPLHIRAQSLVDLFNGKAEPERLFSSEFLAQVPAAQVNAISAQFRDQLGAARSIGKVEARSATAGTVTIDLDKGALELRLNVSATPPHLIEGLLITGSEVKEDNLEKVVAELKALPGQTSLAVAKLGDTTDFLVKHEAQRPMAIGSAFKLFLLAELTRSIDAGERNWTDVVPLSHRSLPSGFLQSWPEGAPLTLYSLAALMISQSDNTATDTLLHVLGREKVEAILFTLGLADAERNRPFLSTMEAFALKGSKDADVLKRWVAGTTAQRRGQLPQLAKLGEQNLDSSKFAGAPNAIGTVEWFASAEDLVRTMDWLRRNGGPKALEIMAINPGIGSTAAEQQDYLGFKGGSELGVINLTFLTRSKAGDWYAVTGSWNDADKPIDDAKFAALMSRAVALVR